MEPNPNRKKVGRYEIIAELGRGGMATVFHAYDPRFERDVALKVLPKALLHDPQFRARFEREAKTIGTLEHPAIVPVYDFGEEDGQPFIVMRLMSGASLTEKLKPGPMTPKEAESIVTRLGQALDAAHEKGIVHRDLKPGNILFDQYGNAFLSDFGIARLGGQSDNLTGSAIIGTPAYMSPEQVQGEQAIDGRSDIYALGIILYHLLTKQMPYQADTPAKLMMAHLLEPVPDVQAIRPDIPDGVAQVIENAMQKNPDDRYLTGKLMAEDYTNVLRGGEPTLRVASPHETDATIQASPRTLRTNKTMVSQPATEMSRPGEASGTATALPGKSKTPLFAILGGILAVAVIFGGLLATGVIPRGGDTTPITGADPTETTLPEASATPDLTEPTETGDGVAAALTESAEPTDAPDATSEPTQEPTPTAEPTSSVPIEGGADKIAFVMDSEIWAANLDGTDLVQLTNDGQTKTSLHWTPDGEFVAFITGNCIKMVALDLSQDIISCFEVAEYLDSFDFSTDGDRIAISLNRELFIVPYDLPALQAARFYTHLVEIATCEYFAPLDRGSTLGVKEVSFSKDGNAIAVKVEGAGLTRLREDIIRVYDISTCLELVEKLDEFPANRFTIDKYASNPILPNFDWDGQFLFVMNGIIRNSIFGDLYTYNFERKHGEKINPIDGRCCYTDAQWSPDGRYLFFAFQDLAEGAQATTVFYFVQFGTLSAGGNIVPMNLPALTNAREAPQVALRPVQP